MGTGSLIPPGGWPDDPAGPGTPVAGSAAGVADLAAGAGTLDELVARQSVCRACPRLVAWRERMTARPAVARALAGEDRTAPALRTFTGHAR